MPINVEVENADHRSIAQQVGGNVESVSLLLPGYDETDFPLLRLVDEYGTTYFSSQQCRELLREWKRLEQRVASDSDRRAWESVRALIEQVAASPHTFLVFIGD